LVHAWGLSGDLLVPLWRLSADVVVDDKPCAGLFRKSSWIEAGAKLRIIQTAAPRLLKIWGRLKSQMGFFEKTTFGFMGLRPSPEALRVTLKW
jgi:hypothetical protein